MPVLSIITVVKNDRAAITKTYESLVGMLGEQVEYVVQDYNGESQLDILENITLSKEKDLGIADACNIAVKNAKGKYLLFWGAGETAIQPAFSDAVNYISHFPADILFNPVLVPESGQILSPVPQAVETSMSCVTPGAMILKDLFVRSGEFDHAYKVASDYEMFVKILKLTKNYCFLHKPIANFSLGGLSTVREYEGWIECELIRMREYGKHPLLAALDLATLSTSYVRSNVR